MTRTDAPVTPCSAAVLTAVSSAATGGAGAGGGGSGGGGNGNGTAQPTPNPNAGGRVVGSAGMAVVFGLAAVVVL